MKAEVSLYLDTRRALKDGTYPVKLHVYYPPKKEKLFPLGYNLTKEDFADSYLAKRPKKEFKTLKIQLDSIISKAADTAKELGELVTFEKFERKMFGSKASTTNLLDHFETKRIELEANDQIGTASSYACKYQFNHVISQCW